MLCKKCNDLCGHSIDSERYKIEKLKVESFSSDPVRVKVENEDGITVNCDMIFSKGKINIFNLPDNNHPNKYKIWEKTFEDLSKSQNLEGYQVNFTTVEKFNFRKAKISDLKSAYLYMFIKLGYRYIFNPNLNQVREQILNSDKKIIKKFSLISNNNLLKESEFLFCQQPLNAIFVKLGHEIIILPDKDSSLKFYEELSNLNESKLIGNVYSLPNDHEMVLDCL